MNTYSELVEPTRVTQCVGAYFIEPETRHLIVAKGTLLQVLEVISSSGYKLQLVDQYKLQGQVTDLKVIRTVENPNLDYILVATKSCKFSLIKWDHRSHSIATVSLHYYEQAVQNVTFDKVTTSKLLVDPNLACTCVRVDNLLTLLPFHVMDEDDEDDRRKEDLFGESFMIEAGNLDLSIGDIIDMQFLHNYKEPTVGLLTVKMPTWSGKLTQLKDTVHFIVLSLDLYSKSSTTVLKIENLPYDIDRIVPLPQPLNGSLLLGCNEIIHVDNGGISRRIAVNDFTSVITTSTKNYVDQTQFNLKLEHCSVVPLDNRVLLVLKLGQFFYINFELDGKSIKKMLLESIDPSLYLEANKIINYPGEIASLDKNLIFIGNKNGDAPLIELDYKEEPKKIQPKKLEDDDLYDEDEMDDDRTFENSEITFVLHDQLINNGPISSFTFGHISTERHIANLVNPNYKEVCLVSNGGSHSSSCINIMTPSIQTAIRSSLSFSAINRMWTLNNKFLVTSDDTEKKSEIFQINKSFARLKSKPFINKETTLGMYELSFGKFILQVTSKHVILFNSVFKRIVSLDKELAKDFKDDEIVNCTFDMELLMLFFASGEVVIYSINTYNEKFTKVAIPKILSDTIITTGYITNSSLLNAVLKDVNLLVNRGVKRKRNVANKPNDAASLGPKLRTFVLVTGDNRIVAFNQFHNERCYQLNDMSKFTDQLTLGFFEPSDAYPDPFIKQVVFSELGDQYSKEEYLTVLTIGGEILIYRLFFDGENFAFTKCKDLPITGAPHNAFSYNTSVERRLVYMPNFNNYTTILVSGVVPYIIMKTTKSPPRIFKFSKIPISSFASYSDNKVTNGVVYLDTEKNARIVELPNDFNYDNSWPVKKIPMKETIKSIAYHETSNTYVVSTFKDIKYNCLDEEGNPIVGTDPSKIGPHSYQGLIKLISPLTWTVIDTIELAENEVGMNVQSMALDVGSALKRFKFKKEYIVVGTGKLRIEDLSANGAFRVLEIIDIIPEPGKPETNHKFKDFNKEDTKGAVTSICEISGRFLVAQGQKIIIRDVQDNGVVPVAFYDTAVYVSEAKSFGNLLLLGDSLKSVWLLGFDAEPFRMIMLGKDLHQLDVNCADFLVKDEEAFILVADRDNVLHVMQYNPEDPTSSNGQRLIHKSAFKLNQSTSCMKSMPKHEEINASEDATFQVVASTTEGSIYTVFPINEASYRRMYVLQQQLIDKEYHYCGLNPKLNRLGGLSFTASDTNSKPLLDYLVIRNFASLSEDRKKNLAAKVGHKNSIQQEIWKDFIEFENVMKQM